MRRILTAAVLAAISLPASAEPSPQWLRLGGLCDTHDGMTAHLANKYGETPAAVGTTGARYIMELFVNIETGTWTVVLTQADGTACGVAAGENFEKQAPAEPAGHRI